LKNVIFISKVAALCIDNNQYQYDSLRCSL
jgi:hypothetical protein